MSGDETEMRETAEVLQRLKTALGADYWQDPNVLELQGKLRRLIGRLGAWGEDRASPHQRARRAAGHERAYARLLWPDGADG
jgi:hypothetical protein